MSVKAPEEKEVRGMFEGLLAADPVRYKSMNLDDTFVGFCIAKGMTAPEALKFVAENSVAEDKKS